LTIAGYGNEMNNRKMTSAKTGPWNDSAFKILERWDPVWSEAVDRMTENPWMGSLDRKTAELIGLAVNAACTNLNAQGTRRHVRGALEAGASRDEILTVLKMASLLSIHTCSLGALMLLDEVKSFGATAKKKDAVTPVCDRMHASGQWNTAWHPFYILDPGWTEEFMSCAAPVYSSGVLDPKLAELLNIAFDVSYTHMYAPGVRRHIRAALKLGATTEEVMDVLKLCVAQGVQACNLGIPILDEELQLKRAVDQHLNGHPTALLGEAIASRR
jgi:alkylhydroperoxidase/carboxymuconolactone decarboxylase family protein YurZ